MGLRVTLPGTEDAIAYQAAVRSAAFEEGVGVAFLDLTPEDRGRLDRFIAHA